MSPKTTSLKVVATDRSAVYITSPRTSAAVADNSKALDGDERPNSEWGVAIISSAAHCADEMSRPDYPDAPSPAAAGHALVILIAVATLEAGAADEGAVDLARVLRANGHHPIIVSGGGRLESSLAASGAEMIRLDVASRSPLAILQNAFVLKRLITQRHCRVVHALARAPAWSAFIAARMTGVPFMTTWYNGFREQNVFKRFYNSVMARGERVVAVSDQIADAIATRYRGASGRIVVVPSQIDVGGFDPALVTLQRIEAVRSSWDIASDTRAIVVIGRILRRKGHHVVVRSAGRLKDMGLRNFSFVFIGEDLGHSSYSGELWDLVQATGTSDVIRIVGPPADLPAAYSAAIAVVSPAIQLEGSQRSVFEAMAMARPVIASDLAAGPEVVLAPPAVAEDRMTGFSFGSGDDRELAAALIRLLSAPESTRTAIGKRGRERALAQFATENAATKMLNLYTELARS